MVLTGAGNVGIGITSPLKKCHVDGELLVTGEEDSWQNEQKQLIFGRGNRNSFDRHHYISGRVDGSSSPAGNYLKFNIDTGSGNGGETFSETMILRGDGNVGIGTDNPGQKLQVNGTISSVASDGGYGLHLTSSGSPVDANNSVLLGFSYSNIVANSNVRASIGLNVKTGGQGRLVFNTGAAASQAERMRIDDVGNVGIGVTNPAAKLDVNGDTIINGRLDVNAICDNSTAVMG